MNRPGTDDRAAVGWLHQRAGLGLHPDDLAVAVGRGPSSELDTLLATPADPPPDPWAGVDLDPENGGRRAAIGAWVAHLVRTDRPFDDRLTWLLHGWLVSSLGKVPNPRRLVDQLGLFMRDGRGSYPDLLRAVTVDPAMLVYLDGIRSTGRAPNENYGRELMELFALGLGNYTEDDVQAAARALTGWVVRPVDDAARFVPRRHDDTPQTLLGVDGVHDVDTVIDAVVGHPAHPRFVATRLVREYLGDPDAPMAAGALDGAVDEVMAAYESSDRRLDGAIRRTLELGLDGSSTPMVTDPIPWLVGALRACGVDPLRLGREAAGRIPELGQVPMLPPDVSGWARGQAWFASSSLIGRANLAAAIAGRTRDDEPLLVALDDGDLDLAATHLGLAEPFGTATTAAIRAQADPVDRLTLTLVCPEYLVR